MAQVGPVEHTVQPYYIRRRQDWAVQQERMRHQQALYQVGEPVLFTMMWRVEDYEAGLVAKCPRCAEDPSTINGRIESVYQQPLTARCPVCFGTTFNGGIRAQIIRPAIVTDADEDERRGARGVSYPENVNVQSTDDFRSRTGDYMFRRDGSRWQLSTPQRTQVRTGYEHPTQSESSIGYASIPAAREDKSSVAFDLPPGWEDLLVFLDNSEPFPDPPPYEVVNGPLIPAVTE